MVRLCSLFGHLRDSRRAHPCNEGWQAPCRWCGERLVRVSPGKWQVRDEAQAVQPAWSITAARHPFDECGGKAVVDARPEQRRNGPRRAPPDWREDGSEVDPARFLFSALFDWATNGKREPGQTDKSGRHPQRPKQRPSEQVHGAGARRVAERRGEAELLTIAFDCCREMLFRMADHCSARSSHPAEEQRILPKAAAANDSAAD